MNNQKKSYQRKLESVFGYVATLSPAWNDSRYDLRYAIDPNARMSMRILMYHNGNRYSESTYAFVQHDAWLNTVEHAEISLHAIDESVDMPSEESVRAALKSLVFHTIVDEWYVAGFMVCEEGGLKILLGYVHDILKLDEPCRLYAIATIRYSAKELHLRFASSDLRISKRFFWDVHKTEAPEAHGSHEYESIRVREFRPAEKGADYDAEDLAFDKLQHGYVPVTCYNNVGYWPIIDYYYL